MRVHLGSDHAGLELKEHLTGWLREQGHEPVDHGPFVYDAVDDYPVFCLRAAEATVADPGSLGVVIGGSGNGEQIAANKVRGVRAALAWSERDRRAGPPAQRRQRDLRGRPDAHRGGDDPVRRHLPDHRLHRRGAARAPDRDAGRLRGHRRAAAAAGLARAGAARATMPEGHTLFRLAGRCGTRSPGRSCAPPAPRAGSRSPPRCSTAPGLVDARSFGKHLFVEFDGSRFVHVHLGLYGKFLLHPAPAPAPVGQVRLRLVGASTYADLRGATACELVTPASARPCSTGSGRTRSTRRRSPSRAWERIRRSRAPIGGLLMDQSVLAGVGNVYRAEVLFRHRMHPLRPGRTLRSGQWRAIWDDLVELMADGVVTGRIETLRPEDRERHDGRNYVYRRTGEPCLVCGSAVRTAELQGRNLFWCPRCQPTFRSRAVG